MDLDIAVLTVSEAAKVLRVSRSFAYELITQGELPALRLGRRVLVPRAALEVFIESHAIGGHGDTPTA
jgi:excisionase family DNA binding protein